MMETAKCISLFTTYLLIFRDYRYFHEESGQRHCAQNEIQFNCQQLLFVSSPKKKIILVEFIKIQNVKFI